MKRLDQRAYDTPPAPSEQRAIPAPLRYPLLLVPAALGASSIATLLLYFYGVAELGHSVRVLLVPSTAALVVLIVWARRTDRRELYDRIMGGLWAGLFASLAYDIARIPIAHAGIPVFRAISYFGTVFLDQPKPTLASEVIGWAYHLSNGVGFGLMYATLFSRPRWWTAVGWGVFLELSMLYTPYAEVFGYQRTATFFTITMGAPVCYGLGLRHAGGGDPADGHAIGRGEADRRSRTRQGSTTGADGAPRPCLGDHAVGLRDRYRGEGPVAPDVRCQGDLRRSGGGAHVRRARAPHARRVVRRGGRAPLSPRG